MDRLRQDDIERARRTSPEERARQLVDVVHTGFRLKRSALRQRFAEETDEQIDERLREWLARRD